MFLEILALTLLCAGALVLYIDYVTEEALRSKIRTEVPGTIYADVENISHKYDTEYGTTYHLNARKKDGTTKSIEVKCKNGNVKKYHRIRI